MNAVLDRLRTSMALWAALAMLQGVVWGQNETIPFAPDESNPLSKRNDAFWKGESASRALKSGLYELAERYAQDAWDASDPSEVDRRLALKLIQVDAKLGQGEPERAEEILDQEQWRGRFAEKRRLRRVAIALANETLETLSRLLDGFDAARLDLGEKSWLQLANGWLTLQTGDAEGAVEQFDAAVQDAAAESPALAARIAYLAYRYRAEAEDETVSIEELRRAYEASRGLEAGFRYAQLLAVALFDEERNEEAMEVVNEALRELPEVYSNFKDEYLLLQLLLSGADSDLGQSAGRQLVLDGSTLPLQRIAMQHLISRSLDEDGRLGDALSETLDSVIAAQPIHPLSAEALYYRGVRNFRLGDDEAVEDDAYLLLDAFPESPYRRGMMTLLASSSWQKQRFRTAASLLTQVRSQFPENLEVSTLSVLIADCYFRAGLASENAEDFANASEAYEVALDSAKDRTMASHVFFQLVLSRLNAGSIEMAKAILDDEDQVGKAEERIVWQAEWMLIKEMRERGRSNEAYERVEQYLNSDDMRTGLQLRMLWLGSKLAYESGLYGDTRTWVERLNEVLDESENSDPTFVAKIRSDGMLTLAESLLALEGESETEGVDLLKKLREDYSGSESSERSYIVEARYLSDRDLVVEAGQLLTYLFDNFPDSRYAPLALYETALIAEKRGQGEYLTQAMDLLERIATMYPDSELVYYARLKQGDLLRKLNRFGTAELVYELLENTYRDRPDRYLAQISLADTLVAQASEDPSKFEAGLSRLELLIDLPEVPLGLRVEAGYKLGNAWENQGEKLKAKGSYWNLYDLLVVEEGRIQGLSEKARYWLSRAMFKLAEIFEDERELDRAIEFYQQIESLGLQGGAVARARIEQIKNRSPLATTQ